MSIRHAPHWNLALLTILVAASVVPSVRAADDPLLPMVRRLDRYLQEFQQEGGVTMDWRYSVSPSEEIRQTVVCQTLAYVELYRLEPRARLRLEIERHADFMLGRLAEIRSHSPFDGMLAHALLAAYATTGQKRFLEAGRDIVDELMAIPTQQCVLNGGLMLAMGISQYALLTGDAAAQQKTSDILAQLASYQNPDGSFPHWCVGTRDIHYTGWMAMELIHLERMTHHASIPQYLASMTAFLESRIGVDGRASYQEPDPSSPGDTLYYYSRASGCWYDYDSRAWTVEPAYCALLFDHMQSSTYMPVASFLASLENGGTWKDQYAYWPPPEDPEYPWTIADTSVVNMSIIFWALTTAVTDRVARGVPVDLALDDLIDTVAVVPPYAPRWLAVSPNPAPGACQLRFAPAGAGPGVLEVFDSSGRRVRRLLQGPFTRQLYVLVWDGRDDRGRDVPNGVYLARLHADGRDDARRVVMAR